MTGGWLAAFGGVSSKKLPRKLEPPAPGENTAVKRPAHTESLLLKGVNQPSEVASARRDPEYSELVGSVAGEGAVASSVLLPDEFVAVRKARLIEGEVECTELGARPEEVPLDIRDLRNEHIDEERKARQSSEDEPQKRCTRSLPFDQSLRSHVLGAFVLMAAPIEWFRFIARREGSSGAP